MMATRKHIAQALADKTAERREQRGRLAEALNELSEASTRLEKVMAGMINATHEGRQPKPNG